MRPCRSGQRSARLRMFSVATCRRSTRSPGSVGPGDRQGEPEGRADAFLRLDPDPAAVALDDVAGDGQAEAGAATRFRTLARPVGLVEALEHAVLGGARDADA